MLKIDELLEQGKFEEVITLQSRKVKWLFNNSNKNTSVIDEKLVRLLVHKLRVDSAGSWVKASERMPNFLSDKVITRLKKSGIDLVFYTQTFRANNRIHFYNVPSEELIYLKWLDESQPQQKEESEKELEERTERNMNVISDDAVEFAEWIINNWYDYDFRELTKEEIFQLFLCR